MKVFFIGHFSNSENVQPGASIAGDSVQRKAIEAFREDVCVELFSLSQPPARSWPKGKFAFSRSQDSYAVYPPMINISFLRDFWFGVCCFLYIIKNRPSRIVQYNSYLLVNLLVLVASLLVKAKAAIIVQDYRVGKHFKLVAKLHDRVAGLLVRLYDLVFPVTDALANELEVKNEKCVIFPGAMEHDEPLSFDKHLEVDDNDSTIKVLYAGALEKHNGLDKIIAAWENVPKNFTLIICGKGSLESDVLSASEHFDNIRYLGSRSKYEVHCEMLKSDFNICLRFSEGLDERFFFPSKFFSVNCYPGFALVNDFYGLPDDFQNIGLLVEQDLGNLQDLLQKDKRLLEGVTSKRRVYLYENHVWSVVVNSVIE